MSRPILVFDTETTGLVNFKRPLDDKCQPHLVQYAGALIDPDTGRVYRALSTIIQPDGWIIPAEAAAVHGIGQQAAMDLGAGLAATLLWHQHAEHLATGIVAHNIDFDLAVLEIEGRRTFKRAGLFMMDEAERKKPIACTMKAGTALCKLPYPDDTQEEADRRKAYKWPKLAELYRHLFGEDFEGAHDALEDVRACAKCFAELRKKGAIQ